MPRDHDSDSDDTSALQEAYYALSRDRQKRLDPAKQAELQRKVEKLEKKREEKEKHMRDWDATLKGPVKSPYAPACLRRGKSSPVNPLHGYKLYDKNKRRLIMSHEQDNYDRSLHPDMLLYDPKRPMPNLLLRLWGEPLYALVNILQYPPPSVPKNPYFTFPKDWIHVQALFLDLPKPQNPNKKPFVHPVFRYHFLTMESLSEVTEDFMIMFARDIPPWIMRKMDNWLPYCELGKHYLLNHYLLGWCWFWLQMEVTQRLDRIRAFLVREQYELVKAEEKGRREGQNELLRREEKEMRDETNPFTRFGIRKDDAFKEANDLVERISGIGALWFPVSEDIKRLQKAGQSFESHFGDAIPSNRRLSGEGNTMEYCIACNLSVVGGAGEEVLTALMANMLARAPCKNKPGVIEEDGGLPRLYPLVDAWIENLPIERAKAVKAKAKKLALTLFVIRKYLRWKKTPNGRDKWLYTDVGTDPYHPRDIKLTPSPTIRMWKDEKRLKREWECYINCIDPCDEEEKEKNAQRPPPPPPPKDRKHLEPIPESGSRSSTSPSRHPTSSSSRRQPASSSSSSSPPEYSHHPKLTSPSNPEPRSKTHRERESYSSKHAVPLSFYNLSNSQVSPAPVPIPSEMVRDSGKYDKSTKDKLVAVPLPVHGVSKPNEEASTALVRTRDYPSETWEFESGSEDEAFDGDDVTTLTCNSYVSTIKGSSSTITSQRRTTNHSHTRGGDDDNDDDIEVMSIATWSHLSAVPEGLNLGKGKERAEREEREAMITREREKYVRERACRAAESGVERTLTERTDKTDRERYRHEGDSSIVSGTTSTSTRDFAAGGNSNRGGGERDRNVVDRERYRHEGDRREDRHGDKHHREKDRGDKHHAGSSSSHSSSRKHHTPSHGHKDGVDKDRDREITRAALKLLSIKDNVKDHLHSSRKESASGSHVSGRSGGGREREVERKGGSSTSSSRKDRDKEREREDDRHRSRR